MLQVGLAEIVVKQLTADIERGDVARAQRAQTVDEVAAADYSVEEVREEMARQHRVAAAPVAEPNNESQAEKSRRLEADLVMAEAAYSIGCKDGVIVGIPEALIHRQVKQPPAGALAVPSSSKAIQRSQMLVIDLSAKCDVLMNTNADGKVSTNVNWIKPGVAEHGPGVPQHDGVARRASACSAVRERALCSLRPALETAQCMVAWFGARYSRRGKVLQGDRMAKHKIAQAKQRALAQTLWKRYELWEAGGFLGLDDMIPQRGEFNCSLEEFLSGTPGPWARARRSAAQASVGYISTLGTNAAQEMAGMQFLGALLGAQDEAIKRADEGVQLGLDDMMSVGLHHAARAAAVNSAMSKLDAHIDALEAAAREEGRRAAGVPSAPATAPHPEEPFANRTVYQLRVDAEVAHGKLVRLRRIAAKDCVISADAMKRFADAKALLARAPQVRLEQAERRVAEASARKARAAAKRVVPPRAAGDEEAGEEDGAGSDSGGVGATTEAADEREGMISESRLRCEERWMECRACTKWRRVPAESIRSEETDWACGDFPDPGWDKCDDPPEFATEHELAEYLAAGLVVEDRAR